MEDSQPRDGKKEPDLYKHKGCVDVVIVLLQITFPDMFSYLICGASAYS